MAVTGSKSCCSNFALLTFDEQLQLNRGCFFGGAFFFLSWTLTIIFLITSFLQDFFLKSSETSCAMFCAILHSHFINIYLIVPASSQITDEKKNSINIQWQLNIVKIYD